MRIILFLFSLIMISCSADKSSSDDPQSSAGEAAQNTAASDSLQVKPTVDFVTGQFDFKKHDDFVQVDPEYTNKEIYLHKKTYQAFRAMADSARKDSISFTIVSGTRNFNYQKSIWDRKWKASDSTDALGKALGILEYSSMPMTSRHHWGTDLDLNNLTNSYFESGQGKKEYEWLKVHANDFGFYQPYTDKSVNGRTGYNEEKWHWSYLPLAKHFLAYYNKHITDGDISGFKGSDLAPEIQMVKNYVNGVSTKIKQQSSN
ncbi:MAG TPA: M15 family metallopeptidase [Fodinibius sp.]|nr:M15 family metallopeptidase [Fodinibius sp.]